MWLHGRGGDRGCGKEFSVTRYSGTSYMHWNLPHAHAHTHAYTHIYIHMHTTHTHTTHSHMQHTLMHTHSHIHTHTHTRLIKLQMRSSDWRKSSVQSDEQGSNGRRLGNQCKRTPWSFAEALIVLAWYPHTPNAVGLIYATTRMSISRTTNSTASTGIASYETTSLSVRIYTELWVSLKYSCGQIESSIKNYHHHCNLTYCL